MTKVWVVTAPNSSGQPDEVMAVFADRLDADDLVREYPNYRCSVLRAWAYGPEERTPKRPGYGQRQ